MLTRSSFNEYDIAEALNGHRIGDLSPSMICMLQNLFGVVDRNETVYAKKINDYNKPDIIVIYRDRSSYVSIKSGEANIFHQGRLSNYVDFLRSHGISDETIKTLLLWHYGDGTIDGTGKRRMRTEELFGLLEEKIQKANEELNTNREFIKQFADYVMFQGVDKNAHPADAIYHGDVENGICIIKDQFTTYFETDNFFYLKYPHIGPFMIKPHARYIDTEIKKPEYRHQVDVYWNKLPDSMMYIARKFPSFNYHLRRGIYK